MKVGSLTKTKGVKKEIDHGLEDPLAGGTDVMQRLQNKLLIEQGREPKHKTTKISSKKKESLLILGSLLALMRAVHWSHWTSHWEVAGESYYGDHLLFARLYEGLEEEIDVLAEKLVAYFGNESVNLVNQIDHTKIYVEKLSTVECPVERGRYAEEILQTAFKESYDKLTKLKDISLGLDDFLMATANNHETNLYLLNQRLRETNIKKAVVKKKSLHSLSSPET